MPFVSKTHVDSSPIHALGLFATELIPKDSVYWTYEPWVNVTTFSHTQYKYVHDSERTISLESKYMWDGFRVYSFYVKEIDSLMFGLDNSRFINHSETPNSAFDYNKKGRIALRDIQAGEEITENYYSYGYPWTEEKDEDFLPVNKQLQDEYLEKNGKLELPPSHKELYKSHIKHTGTIHGNGLFFGVDVPKGSVYWQYQEDVNTWRVKKETWRTFLQSEIERSETSKNWKQGFLVECYYNGDNDSIEVCLDNTRFTNHADDVEKSFFNNVYVDNKSYLCVDVPKDTEIIDNYYNYDECPWETILWEAPVGYPRKNPAVPLQ